MRSLRVFISLLLVASQLFIFAETADATSQDGVVISQVQIGDASQDYFIEMYNNTDAPVDITGWCVRHVSGSGKTDKSRLCLDGVTLFQRLILPARSYVLIVSSEFGLDADFVMSGGFGGSSTGRVYLMNQQQQPVDTFAWGVETVGAEGAPVVYSGNNKTVYERHQASPGMYIDSQDNSTDFFYSELRRAYSIGSIIEIEDVCENLLGIQVLVPGGMILGIDGKCTPESVDLCDNIDGIQLALGPGVEVDDNNDCYQDVCLNLPGFQNEVPEGFQGDAPSLTCSLGILPIYVTELLPNPDGDDKYNEFIELYNPNNVSVDLTYHVFHLGGNYVKTYSFPVGLTIEPHSYLAVYNKDISFTLTNTLGNLRLRTLDNIHVADVPDYANAKSGESWALIGGSWQYTNAPTPNAENTPSSVEQELMTVAFLTDCGEGRERNPLTKRCRNVVSSAKSTVKPCKDGQYRSEETNRCRNIATAANAKPCKDNQYRSEETGRCRNLPVATVPAAGFAVQPVKESGMAFVGWWALGGVALLAGFYAAWEWRRELSAFFARLLKRA